MTPPPLKPGANITIITTTGDKLMVDPKTGIVYISNDTASEQQFKVVNPVNPDEPVRPGDPIVLVDARTGKYCALLGNVPQEVLQLPDEGGARRRLLTHNALPASCAVVCLACYLDSLTDATPLVYDAGGLSYQGTPLVQSPGSATLLLSADPACSVPGGDKLTFPAAVLCEWHIVAAALLLLHCSFCCVTAAMCSRLLCLCKCWHLAPASSCKNSCMCVICVHPLRCHQQCAAHNPCLLRHPPQRPHPRLPQAPR